MEKLSARLEVALTIAKKAGELALQKYHNLSELKIEKKGLQDLVSEADREVELLIRENLKLSYPDDGIIGEEFARKEASQSPYTWVIDPIDGTANFVREIPIWAVVIACITAEEIVIGVVYDPVHDEMFFASKGNGAFLNEKPINTALSDGIHDGLIGIGTSQHPSNNRVITMITDLVSQGGVFCRCGSGALGIVFVACGRYIGYLESFMNAWDCLASILIVKEAGGQVIEFEMDEMITQGGQVVTASNSVATQIWQLAEHFNQ